MPCWYLASLVLWGGEWGSCRSHCPHCAVRSQQPRSRAGCTLGHSSWEGMGSSHLLGFLRLWVVVQEGPFQHRGHNGEALACFEL